jgi:hypothetical protein
MLTKQPSMKPVGFVLLDPVRDIESINWLAPNALQKELNDWGGMNWETWLKHAFRDLRSTPLDASASPQLSGHQGVYHLGGRFELFYGNLPNHTWVTIMEITDHEPSSDTSLSVPSPSMRKSHEKDPGNWLNWLLPGLLHDANNHLIGLVTLIGWLRERAAKQTRLAERDCQDIALAHQYASEALKILQLLPGALTGSASSQTVVTLGEAMDHGMALLRLGLPAHISLSWEASAPIDLLVNPKALTHFLLESMATCLQTPSDLPSGTIKFEAQKISESNSDLQSPALMLTCWMSPSLFATAKLPQPLDYFDEESSGFHGKWMRLAFAQLEN